ncbi:MAG: repeat protein, partial [Verrucomicrobiaceae bacterium]|nr:repeat protein [Verrucomicrobiaceae bacterium]
MHAFRFLFPALVALILVAAQAGAQTSTEDPSDQYFHAFMMYNEAERLAQAGNGAQAVDKYKQAQTTFDAIAKNFPAWQADVMKMRRDKLADALSALQAKIAATPAPAPAAPAPTPGDASVNNQFQTPLATAAPATSAPSLDEAMQTVRKAIEAQMAPIQQQSTELLAQVGRYQLAYETVLKQRDEIAVTAQTLSQTATAQQSRLADLEKQAATSGPAKAELDKLRTEHAETVAQIQELKDRLTKAEGIVMGQTKGLMESSMRLTALQKEKAELAKTLENVTTDREALMKEVEKLTKERDTASAQLVGMKATGPVPASLKDLNAENERLKNELADARKQVETLTADAGHKDQEIAQLKGQLTQIQGELLGLKKENAAYESQVSELTLNLKELRVRMTDPKKAKPGESTQLLAENQLLRGLVLRQLRQQARQQQQKTAVIAEIQKTETASKELIDQVEQIGGARFTLSDDERKLFTTPQLQEFTGEGGIQATLMAKSDSKKSGAAGSKPSETPASGEAAVDGLLEKGNGFLSTGKFEEAANAYSDVLRADPKNASGFAGLAWARVQQNKLDEAEVTLKKSLAYDANNARAHYMLGVNMFRRERLPEALNSFQKSIELNGKNARARHYLGVIASKQG